MGDRNINPVIGTIPLVTGFPRYTAVMSNSYIFKPVDSKICSTKDLPCLCCPDENHLLRNGVIVDKDRAMKRSGFCQVKFVFRVEINPNIKTECPSDAIQISSADSEFLVILADGSYSVDYEQNDDYIFKVTRIQYNYTGSPNRCVGMRHYEVNCLLCSTGNVGSMIAIFPGVFSGVSMLHFRELNLTFYCEAVTGIVKCMQTPFCIKNQMIFNRKLNRPWLPASTVGSSECHKLIRGPAGWPISHFCTRLNMDTIYYYPKGTTVDASRKSRADNLFVMEGWSRDLDSEDFIWGNSFVPTKRKFLEDICPIPVQGLEEEMPQAEDVPLPAVEKPAGTWAEETEMELTVTKDKKEKPMTPEDMLKQIGDMIDSRCKSMEAYLLSKMDLTEQRVKAVEVAITVCNNKMDAYFKEPLSKRLEPRLFHEQLIPQLSQAMSVPTTSAPTAQETPSKMTRSQAAASNISAGRGRKPGKN